MLFYLCESHLYALPSEKGVGLTRFELVTSPLSGVRSNQLSYRPFRSYSLTGDQRR